MRQRLTEIGGDCRIESNPGEETEVRFILPLMQVANGKEASESSKA
jgi:signal transduction histidine kinase